MSSGATLDLAINGGLYFDGTGAPAARRSLGIRDGHLVEVREAPFSEDEARELVDATGRWVMPGFVDLHTHYDAELEAAPRSPSRCGTGSPRCWWGAARSARC